MLLLAACWRATSSARLGSAPTSGASQLIFQPLIPPAALIASMCASAARELMSLASRGPVSTRQPPRVIVFVAMSTPGSVFADKDDEPVLPPHAVAANDTMTATTATDRAVDLRF